MPRLLCCARVGPHLVGIFGRASASVEGFKCSKAMQGANIVWEKETISLYLADPKGYIPKNPMTFPGLKKPEDIANVIAYLREVTVPTE